MKYQSHFTITRAVPACLIIVYAFSGCGLKKNVANDSLAQTAPSLGSVGIKTATMLVASLQKVTGVDPLTATNPIDPNLPLSKQVTLSMGFLSKSPELSSMSSTHLLVATALASSFAREQIRLESTRSAAQRIVCGDVDFTLAPPVALSDAVAGKVIAKFSNRYLQRDAEDGEVASMKECLLATAADLDSAIAANLNVDQLASAHSLANQQAISSCVATAYLSSPDFLRQ